MKINEITIFENEVPKGTRVSYDGGTFEWNGANWMGPLETKGVRSAPRQVQDMLTKLHSQGQSQKPKSTEQNPYSAPGDTTLNRSGTIPNAVPEIPLTTTAKQLKALYPGWTKIATIDDLMPGSSYKNVDLKNNLFMNNTSVDTASGFYLKTPRAYELIKDKTVIRKLVQKIKTAEKQAAKMADKKGDFFNPGSVDRKGFGTLSDIETDSGILGKLGLTKDRLDRVGLDRTSKLGVLGARGGAAIDNVIQKGINKIRGK